MGMTWEEIDKYSIIIKKIAGKYSGDPDLAEDVASEVVLKLYEDKRLDTNKFDPNKKDAAIRNTIRNKTLKVLRSRKIGRWQFTSLDQLQEAGFQVDSDSNILDPIDLSDGSGEGLYDDWIPSDNNQKTEDQEE